MALLSYFTGCHKKETTIPPTPMPAEPLSDVAGAAEEFYVIDGGEVPWGDYGSILTHGMTGHLGRSGSQLQLERTGPFVPPITFPGISDIVVTTEMRDAMSRAGFRGIEFRPVIKAHIVEVDWHTWNLKAESPKYYPEESEPEGYILDKTHSEKMSRQIGDLWEVVVSHGVAMERIQKGQKTWDVEFHYKPGSRNEADLFSCPQNGYKYCSLGAKLWFEEHFPQWTSFKPVLK
jgi:hypothetical protein